MHVRKLRNNQSNSSAMIEKSGERKWNRSLIRLFACSLDDIDFWKAVWLIVSLSFTLFLLFCSTLHFLTYKFLRCNASHLYCFAFKKMFITAPYDDRNAHNKQLNKISNIPWKGGNRKQTSHNNYLEKVYTYEHMLKWMQKTDTEFRPISCWFKRVLAIK